MHGPGHVIPFSFDLSSLVQRSVASLYSHLVTRPTGRALRLGIESQIGEIGSVCLSVLDFTQVVVLDYSCADEAVAKLIQRYQAADRPADAYFVARGLGEQHRIRSTRSSFATDSRSLPKSKESSRCSDARIRRSRTRGMVSSVYGSAAPKM